MANLFEIEDRYFKLLQEIEYNEGEVTEEIEEALQITEQDLKDKLLAYIKFIRMKKAEQKILEDEAAVYIQKAKSIDNLINRLKDKITTAVNLFGESSPKASGKKLKVGPFSVWTVFRHPVVIENDLEFDDERFIQHEIQLKLDTKGLNELKKIYPDAFHKKIISKTSLKNYLDEGNEVKGAYIDKETSYSQFR